MKFHKSILYLIPFFLLLALTACGGSNETPAPTLDTNVVFTQAAQTVGVQLTQTAQAIPSSTLTPTEPPTQASTQTPIPAAGTQPVFTLSISNTQVILTPTLSLIPALPTATGTQCNNSAYVSDLGTPDGTVLKAGQAFQKGWLLQNTGTCSWKIGYALVRVAGNTDFGADGYLINSASKIVPAGEITEISLHLVAPKTPGTYEALYQMYSDLNVPFGTAVSVSIVVRK